MHGAKPPDLRDVRLHPRIDEFCDLQAREEQCSPAGNDTSAGRTRHIAMASVDFENRRDRSRDG